MAKWRRQIRRRLALGVLALAALAVVGVLLTDIDIFFIGVVSGAAITMVMWVRDDPPPFIENWRLGRDGERWTERELSSLEQDGWNVRHDIESRYGNIDHVLVGPGGVFLLNSKNLWGSFAIEEGVLSCHHEIAPMSDYSLPKLERQMNGAAFGLEERSKPSFGGGSMCGQSSCSGRIPRARGMARPKQQGGGGRRAGHRRLASRPAGSAR